MRLVFLLFTLLALPGAADADAFGSCPKSFVKQEIRLPGKCPPCIANNPNCQCSPGTLIGAVCVKGSQYEGVFVVRSTDRKNRKGKVTSRIRYKEGKPFGKHETFHENGRRASRFYYGAQGIEGKWREWHANGKLAGRGEFKDGESVGETEFFYANGQRMSVRKTDGTTVYYLDDGQEFSRVISGTDKPVTFVHCQAGTERRDKSFMVSCENDEGEKVGRYARYNLNGGRKQPVEIGEYVGGVKTQVRSFNNFFFRSAYSPDARPMKF
jgi:hypothetical protein